MQRRQFITLLGGVVVTWPFSALAQQAQQMPRVGMLLPYSEKDSDWKALVAAFKQRLLELGWSEGHNVRLDYRFTGGATGHVQTVAEDLISNPPNVIFAASNVSVAALLRKPHAIPIVFTQVGDPVGSGFVASVSHPDKNITGFQSFDKEIGGKWVQVLREIAPRTGRVAIIYNPNVAANVAYVRAAEAAAASFGMKILDAGVRKSDDIKRVFAAFAREPNGGVIVTPNPVTIGKRDLIIATASRLGLPTIYPYRLFATSGGLISYGYDQIDQWRGAASYVDRILRGAKPVELPVQLPTKYQLVINLKAAKIIGLTVPSSLLARADEVIE